MRSFLHSYPPSKFSLSSVAAVLLVGNVERPCVLAHISHLLWISNALLRQVFRLMGQSRARLPIKTVASAPLVAIHGSGTASDLHRIPLLGRVERHRKVHLI